jgi:hypothetical protein
MNEFVGFVLYKKDTFFFRGAKCSTIQKVFWNETGN